MLERIIRATGEDASLCGITELGGELLAAFSGEAECTDVGDADSGHNVANGWGMSRIEFTVHQHRLSPSNKISK